MRILLTEDDGDLRLAVLTSLRQAGFAVDAVADLPAADHALAVNDYDCAVFDRLLPSGDALDYVASRRRAGWRVPVLFLTGRSAPAERVAGLTWGDDYLGKPFAVAELVLRVRSLCRRGAPRPAPVLGHAGLRLDPGRYDLRRGENQISLTAKEFAVLHQLMAAGGEVVPRARLIAAAWDEQVAPTTNVLDVLVAQIRRKLGPPAVLHTVRGVGYLLR